jgi:hypothetical protein
MKRYLILMAILFVLPACGGSGGDDNSFTESTPITSNQLGAGDGETNPSIASHEAAFGDTAPVLGKGSSNRFDENGNLIGIYAVPYVPSKDQNP